MKIGCCGWEAERPGIKDNENVPRQGALKDTGHPMETL